VKQPLERWRLDAEREDGRKFAITNPDGSHHTLLIVRIAPGH
jgi:hypothetical protein